MLVTFFDSSSWDTLRRLEDKEKLPDEERQRIFHYMDLVIRDYKGKQAYGA